MPVQWIACHDSGESLLKSSLGVNNGSMGDELILKLSMLNCCYVGVLIEIVSVPVGSD